MKEIDFRIMYSKLMETYQLIEFRLRCICAHLQIDGEGTDINEWYNKICDMSTDTFWYLAKRIEELQDKRNIIILDKKEIEELNQLRESRNYWAHQCFIGSNPITFNKKGELKRLEYAKKIQENIVTASQRDERLANKF